MSSDEAGLPGNRGAEAELGDTGEEAGSDTDEEVELTQWEKALLEPSEALKIVQELARLNKIYHEENYIIPARQLREARAKWEAEQEARIQAEEVQRLAAEKAAEEAKEEAAEEAKEEAAIDTEMATLDSPSDGDNSDSGDKDGDDRDEVLHESTSSIFSSIESMSIS